MQEEFCIIEYFPETNSKSCGYCKKTREANLTYGLWAHKMLPSTYQHMIDRNWRRCGKYHYRPVNQKLCCPLYTIRCDTENFQLKNSQKKVIKRFNNYVKFDVRPKRNTASNVHSSQCESEMLDDIQCSRVDGASISKPREGDPSSESETKSNVCELKLEEEPANVMAETKQVNPNKKRYKRQQKLIAKTMKRTGCSRAEAVRILAEKSCSKQKTKSLEQFLAEFDNCPEPKHTFKTKFIPVKSLDDEEMQREYRVFRKYQMAIHKEDDSKVSLKGFQNFLITTSLIEVPAGLDEEKSGLPAKYGGYHQQYLLDDRLIAVAVIDILPTSISSVYLFYDPEFDFLNLGRYSALNEIALVRSYAKQLAELKFYYMGFYIHHCAKMRYKANYSPSYLLCSETFHWLPIDSCLPKLDHSNYARFCEDESAIDFDGETVQDNEILILYNGCIFRFDLFKRKFPRSRHLKWIAEYGRLVGRKCTPKLLYYAS